MGLYNSPEVMEARNYSSPTYHYHCNKIKPMRNADKLTSNELRTEVEKLEKINCINRNRSNNNNVYG